MVRPHLHPLRDPPFPLLHSNLRMVRIPCHHRYFHNQMPNTCPYGGRCKHANGHYLTCQCTAWNLSLQDRQIEYDHLDAGCDDLCKGEMSRAGVAMRQAITQVVLDEFKGTIPLMLPAPLHPTTTMSPAITRDQISAWKRYFEGRVVTAGSCT